MKKGREQSEYNFEPTFTKWQRFAAFVLTSFLLVSCLGPAKGVVRSAETQEYRTISVIAQANINATSATNPNFYMQISGKARNPADEVLATFRGQGVNLTTRLNSEVDTQFNLQSGYLPVGAVHEILDEITVSIPGMNCIDEDESDAGIKATCVPID